MDTKEAGRRGGKAKNAKLTEAQRKEMMAKARAGLSEVRAAKGMPPKIYTLKSPCPQEGCTITNNHDHV